MPNQTTRIEIYDAIWEQPMCEVAQRFEISPSTLSKVCQRHDIPAPPKGHWSRVNAGFVVSPPPLHARPNLEIVKFRGHGRDRLGVGTKKRNRSVKLKGPATKPSIPHDARPRHPHAIAFLKRAERQQAARKTTIQMNSDFEFRVSILPESIRRVSLLLDVLCVLANNKGIEVQPSHLGLAFHSKGYNVALAITEQLGVEASLGTRLELRLDERHYKDGVQRRFFDNQKQCIEDRLSRVVVSIQGCAEESERRRRSGFMASEKAPLATDSCPTKVSVDQFGAVLCILENSIKDCRRFLETGWNPDAPPQALEMSQYPVLRAATNKSGSQND